MRRRSIAGTITSKFIRPKGRAVVAVTVLLCMGLLLVPWRKGHNGLATTGGYRLLSWLNYTNFTELGFLVCSAFGGFSFFYVGLSLSIINYCPGCFYFSKQTTLFALLSLWKQWYKNNPWTPASDRWQNKMNTETRPKHNNPLATKCQPELARTTDSGNRNATQQWKEYF